MTSDISLTEWGWHDTAEHSAWLLVPCQINLCGWWWWTSALYSGIWYSLVAKWVKAMYVQCQVFYCNLIKIQLLECNKIWQWTIQNHVCRCKNNLNFEFHHNIKPIGKHLFDIRLTSQIDYKPGPASDFEIKFPHGVLCSSSQNYIQTTFNAERSCRCHKVCDHRSNEQSGVSCYLSSHVSHTTPPKTGVCMNHSLLSVCSTLGCVWTTHCCQCVVHWSVFKPLIAVSM